MRMAVSAISLILVLAALLPAAARASVLDGIFGLIANKSEAETTVVGSRNVQTLPFLRPAMNIDPTPSRGGGEITIVDDSALVPEEGPSGTIADIEKPKNGTISLYVVREGDTLSGIAKLFNVTTGTIRSANSLTSDNSIQVGQKLVIMPTPGLRYTLKKGDTLASIAKKYGADANEIGNYNQIDDSSLSAGADIWIPNAEAPATPASPSTRRSSSPKARGVTGPAAIFANNPREPAHNIGEIGTLAEVSYYIPPLATYRRTQGIHGYNAVDLAPQCHCAGDPIVASATGDVVVARDAGWNGGYGRYVVIQHDNGSQTLYAHMSEVAVYDGQHVVQGEVIGYVGSSGASTGAHVHFEIRNGIRNPF